MCRCPPPRQCHDSSGFFAGADDAKAEIRAAVRYLLKGATGHARDVIALEIMKIVHQVANGLPPEQSNPLDNDLPGG
jgi:hypothetical protein